MLQTVIVIIAARSCVEELLGGIQAQGFLADRIEAPGLDQLLSVKMNEDGLWLYPGGRGEPALLAWHYGGAIQNLALLPLPEGPERGPLLKAHIEQIAWAGELEGWLTAPPRIHLVASPAEAEAWKPLLLAWADTGVEVVPPVAPAELAAFSAQRAGNNGATTNLLPPEFSQRYHRQLVDRLWMRALMAVLGAYIFGVLVYFGVLAGSQRTYNSERAKLASLGVDYTNALGDNTKIGILAQRQNLKYAALDCWKAVAEKLPDSLTLETFYFNRAKIELGGTAAGEQEEVYAFYDGLRQAQDASHSGPLFSEVKPPTTHAQGNRITWSISCTLRSSESP